MFVCLYPDLASKPLNSENYTLKYIITYVLLCFESNFSNTIVFRYVVDVIRRTSKYVIHA